jgi:hypothetical protein
VHRESNKDDIWSTAARADLTYCVSNGFGTRKDKVLADVQEAMSEWMAAGNVVFRYVPGQDAACSSTNTGVVLNVIDKPGGGGAGCYPGNCRFLEFSYESKFGLYSWLGAWSHEVGHTLGLVHEHVRPECGRVDETSFRAVTDYDSNSGLHYDSACGSASRGQVSALDKTGLATLYGAPSSVALSRTPAAWQRVIDML